MRYSGEDWFLLDHSVKGVGVGAVVFFFLVHGFPLAHNVPVGCGGVPIPSWLARECRRDAQLGSHENHVVSTLKQKLLSAKEQFQGVLQERTEKIKKHQGMRTKYTSSPAKSSVTFTLLLCFSPPVSSVLLMISLRRFTRTLLHECQFCLLGVMV